MKTGAVIAIGVVAGAAATLALTYRSALGVASADVAVAPAVRTAMPPSSVKPQLLAPQPPVAPIKPRPDPTPVQPPPEPATIVTQQEPASREGPDSSQEPIPPAEEPHLTEAGERGAFNSARQHNASVDEAPRERRHD